MKNKFLSYRLSLLAKKKGFDDECLGYHEYNSYNKQLLFILLDNSIKLTESQKIQQQKRPSLFDLTIKNSRLPVWSVAAPLYLDIKEWIFEQKNIYIEIVQQKEKQKKITYICRLKRNGKTFIKEVNFKTEKSALNFGIKKALMA